MTSDSEDAQIKICDFGFSTMIGPSETCERRCGTLGFTAPEILLGWSYGSDVDVWSLGIITYLLLSGCIPFNDKDDEELMRQTVQDYVHFKSKAWETISVEATDFCLSLLTKSRSKRVNLEDIMNLSWFRDDDSIPKQESKEIFKTTGNRGKSQSPI